MELFLHNYLFYLNSEDRHDPFLSLTHSRAHGGTLAMWRRELDPYITILEPVSSRILVLILDKPGFQISAHIAIYLTTSGHDAQYMQDLALLQDTIDTITDKYPDCITYIRGDANASVLPRANNKRDDLFKYFTEMNNLTHTPTNHTTYHHFVNDGKSDSSIDVLLSPSPTSEATQAPFTEILQNILCGKTN